VEALGVIGLDIGKSGRVSLKDPASTAGGWSAGHRMAACAVRLQDGRLVWCKVDL
jgi:hypothetical protein